MKMKIRMRPLLASLSAIAIVSAGLFASAGCAKKSTVPALTSIPASTATQPEPRNEKWVQRHEGFVETAKAAANCQVLFIGDSITDGWRNEKKGALEIWTKSFGQYNPVNLGISGDRTQHVLWRLQNGELASMKPKAVVLMIGTNNTGFERDKTTPRNTPAETANGVTAIVSYLREKLPEAKILLLAVFPRGEKPDHPQRVQVGEINALIQKLHDGKKVFYLDIGQKFLATDGTLPKDVMPDFLHPNANGYQIWADAIRDPLAALVK